jgi:hypothetical protein
MHKGPTPTRPWQHITVDFVDVPSVKNVYSQDRMDQVMVVVDSFTKQTILIPAKKSYTTKRYFISFGKEYSQSLAYQKRLRRIETRYSDPRNGYN